MHHINRLWVATLFTLSFMASAQDPIDSVMTRLNYEGAFRLPVGTIGESRLGWANGKIALNPFNQTFFIVGHAQHQAIAEFNIPDPVKSSTLKLTTRTRF